MEVDGLTQELVGSDEEGGHEADGSSGLLQGESMSALDVGLAAEDGDGEQCGPARLCTALAVLSVVHVVSADGDTKGDMPRTWAGRGASCGTTVP